MVIWFGQVSIVSGAITASISWLMWKKYNLLYKSTDDSALRCPTNTRFNI